MQRASTRLVATSSSDQPPADDLSLRWRRRPWLAALVRLVVVVAPLAASVAVGVLASRQFRPHHWGTFVLWALWVAAASLMALWAVDVLTRRLLPLHRLLQLCLAFPDRAPSRIKIALHAARARRPEAILDRPDAPAEAAAVAERIVMLLAAMSVHDRRTRGHSERVCAFAQLLAKQMRLSQAETDRLTWVALVHDVGKLHVPARLLNKPDRPTVHEWHLLKTHPERGAAMTEPLRAWLGPWVDAVLEHHERYDGAGYPRGLRGDEISLAARLIAVVDAFEVMTAPRPYRKPVDAQTARAELARQAGAQFDPVVVRHFLAVGLPDLRRVMGPLSWLAQLPFLRSWPRLETAASSGAAHAATITVAASTAGLLVLGSNGSVVAAAAAAPSGGIDDESLGTSPATPTAQDVGDHHGGAAIWPQAGAGHAPTTPHGATRSGGSPTRPALARRSGARSSAAVHEASATGGAQPPTAQAPTAQPRTTRPPTARSAATGSALTEQGQHRAYGHDHAPGWRRNWPDGHQPGEGHPTSDRHIY